ncbi:GyrI-like domain-containing protein [Bdellovibrio sp. HCB-162]|uniref:GyrI-like domain-containing protein n=1 Tax=Bdellovibrio sp. HCB-162 TaxID=3394234 RepID=UPI0039BCA209
MLVTEKEFYLVGFETRTDNKTEMTSAPGQGQIAKMWERIFKEDLKGKVPQTESHDIFAIYSNYESDETGRYDYFLGYKVANLDSVPQGLVGKKILAGSYKKYVTKKGLPYVVVPETWAQIWAELKGQRLFKTDFEVYGEKAQDPNNAIVDVYVGVKG